MSYAVRVDCFSGALGDMPPRMQGDPDAVMSLLAEHPRFSVFDVTDRLGRTLEQLRKDGRLRFDNTEGYPWTSAEVLPAPDPCTACGGRGRHHRGGRHWKACLSCHGNGWLATSTEEDR